MCSARRLRNTHKNEEAAMKPQTLRHYAFAISLVGGTALGCGEQPQPSSPQSEVVASYDALRSAIADCGAALGACSHEAAGDVAAQQACRDTFSACVEPSLPEPPAAATAAADDDDDAGAGSGEAHESPVRGCIDALLACVMADTDASVCAQDVRACVIASVPAPPGVIPTDPGSQAGDAGMPGDVPPAHADAGMPGDVPPTPPTPDAGMMPETPEPADCAAALDACIAAGGTQSSCAQELRMCGKP